MASPTPPESSFALESIPGFDCEANDRHYSELVSLIAQREAVAVVGAGISRPIGYDTWGELLQHLAERANDIRPGLVLDPWPTEPHDYLAAAQRIRDHITDGGEPKAYHDEIGRRFSRSDDTIRERLTPLHTDLVRLPFRGFVTTNYEQVIEIALGVVYPERFPPPESKAQSVAIWKGNDSRLISPAVRSIAAPEGVRYVLHLHGVYWTESSIILSADEYAEAYGIPDLGLPRGQPSADTHRTPPAPRTPSSLLLLTTSLLATRRVVFLGFSLDDVYFTEVLRRVSNMLWEWRTATHFALMPIERERAKEHLLRADDVRSKMGIETVFYPVEIGDHGALADLVARIAKDVGVAVTGPYHRVSAVPEGVRPPFPEWAQRNNAQQLERIERRA